jgi:hypothetical protein
MPKDAQDRGELIAGCIHAGYTAMVFAVVAQTSVVVQALLAAPLTVLAWELRASTARPRSTRAARPPGRARQESMLAAVRPSQVGQPVASQQGATGQAGTGRRCHRRRDRSGRRTRRRRPSPEGQADTEDAIHGWRAPPK